MMGWDAAWLTGCYSGADIAVMFGAEATGWQVSLQTFLQISPENLAAHCYTAPPSIMISCLCLFVKGISLPGRNMHTSSQTWQKELGVHELKRSATSESSVLPSKPSISFQTIRVSFFSSLVVVYSTRVNATIRANKGSYTVHTRHTSEQACTL